MGILTHAFRLPATAILTLAVGIAAGSSIFSLVNAVLLRPLPYGGAARLMMVWEQRPKDGTKTNGVTPADFLDWRAQSRSFASLTAHDQSSYTLTEGTGAERVTATLSTVNLLETYQV